MDEAESIKEEAAVAKLEFFMTKFLKENRAEAGVHYSNLFENYLPIEDKPRRLLQDRLPEFFFKTADGTWRPPKNDEERKQKAALRSSGALRRIKRFANALVEGVPPYEKDRPENAATLADWIRQCRRAGLYDYGRILYEKGGLRFDGLATRRRWTWKKITRSACEDQKNRISLKPRRHGTDNPILIWNNLYQSKAGMANGIDTNINSISLFPMARSFGATRQARESLELAIRKFKDGQSSPVKNIVGVYGSGKTMLKMAYGFRFAWTRM